jgi:hypothetical protein
MLPHREMRIEREMLSDVADAAMLNWDVLN